MRVEILSNIPLDAPVGLAETLRSSFCTEFNVFALRHDVLTLPPCTCSLEFTTTSVEFIITAPTAFTLEPTFEVDVGNVLQSTLERISPSNEALLDVSATDLEFIFQQILFAEKHTLLT